MIKLFRESVNPSMLEYDPLACLPSSEELPDNELQDLIPGLLKAILAMA